MQIDNSACYECPKGKNKLHSWYLMNDGLRAKCGNCGLVLDKDQTLDVYERHLSRKEN